MIVTDELCVIQDRISKNLIGVGELRGGVYCFNRAATMKVQANAVATNVLWHSRLGHLSNHVLSLLSKDLGVGNWLGNNKVDVCEVCHCAKQTQSQFSISKSITNGLFEIIHYDIWGSYQTPSFCGAHYFLTVVGDASRAC